MQTVLVPLIGDVKENLYQLGIKEASSFRLLEERVTLLLSTSSVLRYGQDIISRARSLMKKKDDSYFQECIEAYAEGLGIEPSRYFSFLNLFELAAHYGQVYPELKGLLPGCTSLFQKSSEGLTHTRLLDFPLIGFFEERPRLYYWQSEGRPTVLSYSCEGLAPLFFQIIHGSGFSMALHHKPGTSYHRDGQSIFKIVFDSLFDTSDYSGFKREIKKRQSMTKWGVLALDQSGVVVSIDLDGPNINTEKFNLHETSPLIFTNIPIQTDFKGHESFLHFCSHRQSWLKEKLAKNRKGHILDIMTDVGDQRTQRWLHPSATLSSVGGYHVNLTLGQLDIKEGHSALVASDAIVRFSLGDQSQGKLLKEKSTLSDFEEGWKRAALAQAAFDQGKWDEAYHQLQMALALMPNPVWKEMLTFFLCIWDFRFLNGKREMLQIYKKVKKLKLPELLKDQWIFLIMRMEKKLELVPTVTVENVAPELRETFLKEKVASTAVFSAWMKLLYPRIEILDVFSPHHK